MIINLFSSFLISILIGYFILTCFYRLNFFKENKSLSTILSLGAGVGASSLLFFVWLFTTGSSDLFVIFECFILVLLLCIFANKKQKTKIPAISKNFINFSSITKYLWIKVTFAAIFLLNIFSFYYYSLIYPYGHTDAMSIWNLKAKFFYLTKNHEWMSVFNNPTILTHPDYPLLIPGFIAKTWEYTGNQSQLVPVYLGLFFTILTVLLLLVSISRFNNIEKGLFAAIILTMSPAFFMVGASQTADIPLSFYFLCTVILLHAHKPNSKNYALSGMTGFFAGLAAWTKNEGILFFLLVLIFRFLLFLPHNDKKIFLKNLTAFLIGSLPVISILLFFKIFIAPPGDILGNKLILNEFIANITDLSRYSKIISTFWSNITSYLFPGILALLAFLLYLFNQKLDIKNNDTQLLLINIVILTFMIIGYGFIYLISSYSLDWHLNTSLFRILLQIFPSILFICFCTKTKANT